MPDLFGTEELEIKIKVITVDGKRMSKSLFFQLKEEQIVREEEIKETNEWRVSLRGTPIGYFIIGDAKILLWQKGGELIRCSFPHRENIGKAINKECINVCYEIPHLFLGA